MPKLLKRFDGWMNAITGLGASRDKLVNTIFSRALRLSDQELENLFDGDDLAARIVEALPDDALRQGFEIDITPEDDEDSQQVEEVKSTAASMIDTLEELEAIPKLNEAWVWGRLFGGGAVWMITDDGSPPDQPLNLETLTKVTSLMVLDKRSLVPHTEFLDFTQPEFGQIETYRINRIGTTARAEGTIPLLIHSSRLIVFEGERTSLLRRQENDGWANSVLQRPCEVLRNFNVSFQAISHLMVDSSQGVFKMEGLIDMLGSGGKDTVQERMEVVDMGRSVARAIVLDAENEDFERKDTTFTGHEGVLQKLMLRLAAAARMPVTVLMGQSPTGMNATGESDRALWEDQIKIQQTRVLQPRLQKLIKVLFASREGPTGGAEPEKWSIEFNPLRQMTEAETADTRLKVAQADAVYLTHGVVLPEEVALSRFGAAGFSMDTSVDLDLRKQVLSLEAEKELERAQQPDPVPPPVPGQEDDQEDPPPAEDE